MIYLIKREKKNQLKKFERQYNLFAINIIKNDKRIIFKES